VTPPLFLSRMDQTFWEHPLPEHDAFYVQVNNIANDTDETIVRFGWRLHSVLSESGARNLILDLRHNNGGQTQLYPQLLRSVIAFSRMADHQVYVLIGRRTYSPAGNFVTDLERLANPIFVGEANSQCCNLYGDPTSVALPYSGILGELTAYKWQLSTPGDRRREISPDVPVQLTAADYFTGLDPVLAAVQKLIAPGATGLPRYWYARPAPVKRRSAPDFQLDSIARRTLRSPQSGPRSSGSSSSLPHSSSPRRARRSGEADGPSSPRSTADSGVSRHQGESGETSLRVLRISERCSESVASFVDPFLQPGVAPRPLPSGSSGGRFLDRS
jgi:hypothetical protein